MDKGSAMEKRLNRDIETDKDQKRVLNKGEDEEEIRLNKYLSMAGFCSRREADRLIGEGRVKVDGLVADTGMKIRPSQTITVDDTVIEPETERLVLAVNKPEGVVCTTDRSWGDRLIEDIVDSPVRVFSVGRLDKNSEGLLLMTNQGDLANRIQKASNYHEKEYLVTVDHDLSEGFLKNMKKGVYLEELNVTTRPCRIGKTGSCSFRIILTQGLNRQIRRMCSTLGYQVVKLKRIRVMNIELGDLPSGATRRIRGKELETLLLLAGGKEGTEEQI